jgi:hypothetical protein
MNFALSILSEKLEKSASFYITQKSRILKAIITSADTAEIISI